MTTFAIILVIIGALLIYAGYKRKVNPFNKYGKTVKEVNENLQDAPVGDLMNQGLKGGCMFGAKMMLLVLGIALLLTGLMILLF